MGGALLSAQAPTPQRVPAKPTAACRAVGGAYCPESNPMAAPAETAAAPGIPTGAKEVEPYLYRYTDAQGKTWMYRKSPFGLMKWEEKAAPQSVVQQKVPIQATDLGDSYRFVRDTPFGGEVWTRKKSNLTEDEKAVVAKTGEK